MIPTRLKKTLDDNLSLSTKLLLKELLIALPRGFQRKARAPRKTGDRAVVAIFDERIPTPDRDAGSLRMLMILKTLATRFEVVLVPFSRSPTSDYEDAIRREGIQIVDVTDYRRLLKQANVQAAIVSRPSMARVFTPRIRRLSPKTRIIFDTVDVHFVRLQREYELTGDLEVLADAKRHRELETDLAKASDLVWCASVEDKELFEREAKGREFAVVSTIHELRDRGKTFAERQDLLFVGNFAHRPNEDAVLFFMKEIYPHVSQFLPNVGLNIIGGSPSIAMKAYASEQVRILGYVPNIDPYLQSARVFIAPLRFGGAGTKGKVGEAMAHGVPVVATSIGAEGFGLTHGLDVMIGDNAASFAQGIQQLYSNQESWQRLADNGWLRIQENFTPKVVADRILRSIDSTGSEIEPR